jgi:crotonobetainyl-CoA:carnitine CoA-transferase CaiB-like acyl-CoA transferase
MESPLPDGSRTAPRGLLGDVTVVSIEQAVSAPICTRTLADLGARVIKVENPEGGDFTRTYDSVVNGLAAHFAWLGRGKESVTLNLKDPGGIKLLSRLLERADVLVTNLAPGATTRLGLDAATLRQAYPRLISLEISGYGADGPLSGKRAYDLLIQAESGVCAITGQPGQPAKPGPPFADVCTGLYGAITILAALHDRGLTGPGIDASVSMFDTMVELMGYPLTHARYTGANSEPAGMGSPAVAPYGAYRTADGQTVVLGTTNDAEWVRLASMIGRPDLGRDERYRHNPDRVQHRNVLDDFLGSWCGQRSLESIQTAADEAGIGNARYNTPLEVLDHQHLVARHRWREVSSPAGPVIAALPPPVIPGRPPQMGAIPGLGEHTEAILTELGLSDDAIATLRESGTI